MNAPTITMPKEEARAKLKEYHQAVRDNPRDETYRTMHASFRALVRGHRLIDVSKAIVAGGVDEKGFPKLALARADWPDCWCQARKIWGDPLHRRLTFSREKNDLRRGRVNSSHLAELTLALSLNVEQTDRARVPIIPPALKPAGRLSNYSILFEAEWDYTEPADPFLLRHLGGTLYVILDAWDLTDVERAIFGASRATS